MFSLSGYSPMNRRQKQQPYLSPGQFAQFGFSVEFCVAHDYCMPVGYFRKRAIRKPSLEKLAADRMAVTFGGKALSLAPNTDDMYFSRLFPVSIKYCTITSLFFYL
jgi:hypothetical protein